MATERPKITSLRFDHDGWRLREQTPQQRVWQIDEHLMLTVRFLYGKPPMFPLSFEPAYLAYEEECLRKKGVVVSFNVLEFDGVPASLGVSKHRSPLTPQAMLYVGTLDIPARDFSYHLSIESAERDEVGLRETQVMALRLEEGLPWVDADAASDVAIEPPNLLPSDNDEYDGLCPQHPLTVVRQTLKRVYETGAIDECVKFAALPR